MWIRVHKDGTVVCVASNRSNLHSAYGNQLKLTDEYTDSEVEQPLIIGDKANGTKQLNRRVQPNEEDLREAKIVAEIRRLAEQSLIARGEIQEITR